MAQIVKEIKDEYVITIAKALGFSYDPKNVPTVEEHLAAIQSKVDEMIDPLYEKIVLDDPEVIAKQAELDSIIDAKIEDSKPTTIKL